MIAVSFLVVAVVSLGATIVIVSAEVPERQIITQYDGQEPIVESVKEKARCGGTSYDRTNCLLILEKQQKIIDNQEELLELLR